MVGQFHRIIDSANKDKPIAVLDFAEGEYSIGQTSYSVTGLLGGTYNFANIIPGLGLRTRDTVYEAPKAIGDLLALIKAEMPGGLTFVIDVSYPENVYGLPLVTFFDNDNPDLSWGYMSVEQLHSGANRRRVQFYDDSKLNLFTKQPPLRNSGERHKIAATINYPVAAAGNPSATRVYGGNKIDPSSKSIYGLHNVGLGPAQEGRLLLICVRYGATYSNQTLNRVSLNNSDAELVVGDSSKGNFQAIYKIRKDTETEGYVEVEGTGADGCSVHVIALYGLNTYVPYWTRASSATTASTKSNNHAHPNNGIVVGFIGKADPDNTDFSWIDGNNNPYLVNDGVAADGHSSAVGSLDGITPADWKTVRVSYGTSSAHSTLLSVSFNGGEFAYSASVDGGNMQNTDVPEPSISIPIAHAIGYEILGIQEPGVRSLQSVFFGGIPEWFYTNDCYLRKVEIYRAKDPKNRKWLDHLSKPDFPAIPNPNPTAAQLSLLLPFEGADGATTTLDRSQYGHIPSFEGTAAISGTVGRRLQSSSLHLPANTDRVTVPANAVLNLANVDFTVDFMVYRTAGSNGRVCGCSDAGNLQWEIIVLSDSVRFKFSTNGTSWNGSWDALLSDIDIPLNQWTWITVSWHGSNAGAVWPHVKIRVNGTIRLKRYVSSNLIFNTNTSNLTIGAEPGGSNGFIGNVQNLRIVKGTELPSKDDREIEAPLREFPGFYDKLIVPFEGEEGQQTATDESIFGHAITFLGDAAIDAELEAPVRKGSLFVPDIAANRAEAAASADFQLGSGPFTIEGLVRRQLANERTLIALWSQLGWRLDSNSGVLNFHYTTDGTVGTQATLTGTVGALPINGWDHFVADRDTAGDFRMWIGGVLHLAGTALPATIHPSGGNLTIGGRPGQNGFSGHLKRIKIYKGRSIYGDKFGDTNFTPEPRVNEIRPTLYKSRNVFKAASLSLSNPNLQPIIYVNENTFGQHQLSYDQFLTATRHDDPDSFGQHLIGAIEGATVIVGLTADKTVGTNNTTYLDWDQTLIEDIDGVWDISDPSVFNVPSYIKWVQLFAGFQVPDSSFSGESMDIGIAQYINGVNAGFPYPFNAQDRVCDTGSTGSLINAIQTQGPVVPNVGDTKLRFGFFTDAGVIVASNRTYAGIRMWS